jgi:acyl-CoA thioester hydrolase
VSEASADGFLHTTTARVRYAETDQAGVAYHSNFLLWFEIGRTELFRDLGLPYARLERERGIYLTVTETALQYHRPARYDDLIVIESRITDVKGVRLRISTNIRRQDSNALLCTGHVWLAAVSREGRPSPLPEDVRSLLRTAPSASGKMVAGESVTPEGVDRP